MHWRTTALTGTICLILTGCTTLPAPTCAPCEATQTATPTPTLNAEQTAALKAVITYRQEAARIAADPSKFSKEQMVEILSELAGDNVIEKNISSYLDDGKKGYRTVGEYRIVSTDVSQPAKATIEPGRQTRVDICVDQSQTKLLDNKDKSTSIKEKLYDGFLRTVYIVRKNHGEDTWKVRGWIVEDCAP